VTPEAFHSVYQKEIAGLGELLRWLSYEKVGTSTIQNRATTVVSGGTYLFALAGLSERLPRRLGGILVRTTKAADAAQHRRAGIRMHGRCSTSERQAFEGDRDGAKSGPGQDCGRSCRSKA
jgi:hypothetical protein